MKLVKSLLLGSAAGLAAVAGAQAADLPVKKAAAVEYVRVCSTYGAGFFYVPGTESCLRIGGRVRADVLYQEPLTRAQDAFGIRVRGRLNVDHRTATAYGLLRTYLRYEIDRNSGAPFGQLGQVGTNAKLQQAFVQFGGLTAGRVTSFFSNADLPTQHMGTLRFDDAPDVALFAYTFSFGNGFTATLSLEDSIERRVNNTTAFGGFPVGTGPVAFAYGGQRYPDLVGNIRYAGTWGGVQLSGVIRQTRDVGGGVVTPAGFPIIADSEIGYAVGLSGYVNLPMLGAGDAIWAFGTYTDGAFAYLNGGQDAPSLSTRIGAGDIGLPVADAFINRFTGDIETTKAWSIAAGVTHNWTPELRSSLFGSYMQFDAPAGAAFFVPVTPATVAAGTAGTASGLVDFQEFRVGANTFWQPVTGLNLGVEVLYTRVESDPRVVVPATNFAGAATTGFRVTDSEDIWEGRLRVQRDF
jgi:hypothetical protein